MLKAPERKASGGGSPRATSKKSLQLTRLQGSADALVQVHEASSCVHGFSHSAKPQAEPHVDTAYVNALNHLIAIFEEIVGAQA